MLDKTAQLDQLRSFSRHYDYDAGYLEALLEAAPEAFEVFLGSQPMSQHRRALTIDAHHVARITAMLGEDCGACAQLNVRMALEAGVDRELLRTLLENPEGLPDDLRDVHQHVRSVTGLEEVDEARAARIRKRHGEAGFAELAVVIAGCRIYPTIKRSMLMDGSCAIVTVDL